MVGPSTKPKQKPFVPHADDEADAYPHAPICGEPRERPAPQRGASLETDGFHRSRVGLALAGGTLIWLFTFMAVRSLSFAGSSETRRGA